MGATSSTESRARVCQFGETMRPTECAKHKALREKIAADVEAFLAAGRKPTAHKTSDRALPPVDHWEDRVTTDYRTHHEAQAARRLKRGQASGGEQ